MKISRNTPEQLILDIRPIWLAIFVSVFGLVFLGVGLAIVGSEKGTGIAFILAGAVIVTVFNLAFIRRTQLILDRPRNLIELRRKSFLGYSSRTWELQYLDKAVVETSRSSDTNTHRAALVISDGMDAGTHPVTLVYSSGSGARRSADAINSWQKRALLDSDAPDA